MQSSVSTRISCARQCEAFDAGDDEYVPHWVSYIYVTKPLSFLAGSRSTASVLRALEKLTSVSYSYKSIEAIGSSAEGGELILYYYANEP